MKNFFEEMKKYEALNNISEPGGAVFFGSSYLSSVPVSELSRDCGMDIPVHNRSIEGLTMAEAQQALDKCVVPLKPQKVFLNIGDCDIEASEFNIEDFISKYEWLLYTLHIKCSCRIYVLSVVNSSSDTKEINSRLKQLCEIHKCEYIDLKEAEYSSVSLLDFFDKIKFYMRSYPISFSEAMNVS